MPVTTKAEVKTLLQIAAADTSKDNIIDSLIVKVQDFIVRRINNFIVPEIYIQSDSLSFVASSKKIIDADAGLAYDGFAIGNDILVLGSYQNDKIFSIKTISAGEIEVNETIVDEAAGNLIFIRRVQFTEDIKMAAADFIAFKLNKDKTVKSRSLGDYSESFFSPQEMLETFSAFKKLQWD